MFIKSIIIDGFKSYGRRTELHEFDPEFTAITGLNGTGKSNILDSICFVLGISNLGHVRATSLQDLVYKSGQAGITKASVTLIFDNSNVNQCPLGYEKCREISVTRQIVVNGKNKYLINGKLVQNKKVSDFFCSVQLNVNNPNFLIMQGRITKVLNMKPQEILSMIEEAAGTSLYESKRDATTKLLQKKDVKIRETSVLLHEEVEPKLHKLRSERSAYVELQKICRDIEYLTRLYVSHRFLKYKEAIKSHESTIQKIVLRVNALQQNLMENEIEEENINEKVKEISQKIDAYCGGDLKKIETELENELLKEAAAAGNLKANQTAIDQERQKLSELMKTIADDGKSLQIKEKQLADVKNRFESLKACYEKNVEAHNQAQKRFEGLTQGLTTNDDGEVSSLQDQLIDVKKCLSETQTAVKMSEMELKHSRQMLQQKQNQRKSSDLAYNKEKQFIANVQSEIRDMHEKLQSINYENGTYENLQAQGQKLQEKVRELRTRLDNRNASRYELQYRDPEPGFDRSKVCGMMGKLFTVNDNKFYLALTTTAGGHLYSFVTDDDITSSKVLQKGNLKNRCTIIPINKVKSYALDESVVKFAQELVGEENCQSALSTITFDPKYLPVMKFVFGRTLICRDLNIAKQVTFHRKVRCRTVTLDGDIVDPEGTLSGGCGVKNSTILQDLGEIKNWEDEMKYYTNEANRVLKEIRFVEPKMKAYNKLKETIDLREHELNACKERLTQSTHQQNHEEIEKLQEHIKNVEDELLKVRELEKSTQNKIKEIEERLSDAKGYRERELNQVREIMKQTKSKAEKSHNDWKAREQECSTLSKEIEILKKDLEKATEQCKNVETAITKLEGNQEHLRAATADVGQSVVTLRQQLKERKEEINQQNKELKELHDRKEKLLKHNQDINLEIKKRESEINKVRTDNKSSFKKVEDLQKRYSWIVDEEEFFGIKNTRYDYSKEDPVEAGQKLNTLNGQKEKMERHVNVRAMALLEREEEKYNETMKRRKIVEQDKEKIKHIIGKMDEKKREAVDEAWQVVNENFSSIFNTLLQGAQACLNPIINNQQLLGLEIKVGFNGVWKESLGELSGGQRSLVALSLVLAMLKFSPAPLYILDEVDAALDMSHTQNVGKMLKKHFTSSQFIIVSLKDGMFNNANVLFRTKFEEGVSSITRTVNPRLQ